MNARNAAAARRGRGDGGQAGTDVEARRQAGEAAGTMRHLLEQMKPELALALPKHMSPERMARQALTAFRTTPKLDECSPQSFLGALMTCAQLGLEPGPQGYVYLIPFANRRRVGGEWRSVMEATLILGYQGMIELARRSSELVDIVAHTVYSNEVEQGRFRVTYGTTESIEHDPIVFGDRGDPVGYYATAVLRSGGRPFVVLSKADVEKFRERSATQKADNPSGPWLTDYDAMAWKTCVRRLSRWLPQSVELAAAVAHEETVRTEHASQILEQQQPHPDEQEADEPDRASLEANPVAPPAEPVREPQRERQPAQQTAATPAPAADPRFGPEPPAEDYPEPDVPEPGGSDDPWAGV